MSATYAPSERFSAARQIDCANVLRDRTGYDGKQAGQNTLFRCPFHDDHDPSLIAYPAGRGFWCPVCEFGGDAVDLVARQDNITKLEALERLETRYLDGGPSDRASQAGASQPRKKANRDRIFVRAYDYQNPQGQLAHQTVRFDPKDFSQRRPDGKGGWIWSLKDCEDLYPYRLPSILAADPDEWIYWTEGEKDADRLAAHGLTATTTPMGAGFWRDSFAEWFRGRRVALLLDNDAKGIKHGQVVGRGLDGIAREVRIIEFPDAEEKADVTDYLDGGGTIDGLKALLIDAPAWSEWMTTHEIATDAKSAGRIPFLTAREFAAQTSPEVDWIVRGLVAPGAITKLDGPPKKAGKTTLITYAVAAVLDGTPFLGHPTKQGPVVILSEQGGTSLREALQRANLLDRTDLHLALYRDTAGIPWREVVDEVMDFVDRVGAVLLVVDTLPACSGVRGDDENSSGRAMEALEPLQIGADVHNVGVIVSFHDRKGGGEVGDSGRGSTAYAGAVDIIVHLTRPGGNFDPAIRKLEALSRFDATPDELYIQLTSTGYVALGDELAVVSAALQHALLKVLPLTEDEAKRIASIKDKETGEVTAQGLHDELSGIGVKVARSTLDNELKRWVDHGYVGRSGDGKKGSPARYWLVKTPPEAFFRTKPAATSEETSTAAPEASQKHSSDVHPPSEEPHGGPLDVGDDRAMISSDAPSPIDGRNHFDAGSKTSPNGHIADFAEAEWEEAAAV